MGQNQHPHRLPKTNRAARFPLPAAKSNRTCRDSVAPPAVLAPLPILATPPARLAPPALPGPAAPPEKSSPPSAASAPPPSSAPAAQEAPNPFSTLHSHDIGLLPAMVVRPAPNHEPPGSSNRPRRLHQT